MKHITDFEIRLLCALSNNVRDLAVIGQDHRFRKRIMKEAQQLKFIAKHHRKHKITIPKNIHNLIYNEE